jgi:hypothetical protein
MTEVMVFISFIINAYSTFIIYKSRYKTSEPPVFEFFYKIISFLNIINALFVQYWYLSYIDNDFLREAIISYGMWPSTILVILYNLIYISARMENIK